jgi:rRNA maturation RNase YbeY
MSLTENNNLTYDIELDCNSLRCTQPIKIKKGLKPHQLACLYKAIYMENVGSITYKNRDVSLRNNPYTIKISTNIGIIGDIVLCPAFAEKNGKQSLEKELELLTVHGVLHLLGYDHQEILDEEVMFKLQEDFLNQWRMKV